MNNRERIVAIPQSDWEKIRSGEREPHPYALVWLASILRYVGENALRDSPDEGRRD